LEPLPSRGRLRRSYCHAAAHRCNLWGWELWGLKAPVRVVLRRYGPRQLPPIQLQATRYKRQSTQSLFLGGTKHDGLMLLLPSPISPTARVHAKILAGHLFLGCSYSRPPWPEITPHITWNFAFQILERPSVSVILIAHLQLLMYRDSPPTAAKRCLYVIRNPLRARVFGRPLIQAYPGEPKGLAVMKVVNRQRQGRRPQR